MNFCWFLNCEFYGNISYLINSIRCLVIGFFFLCNCVCDMQLDTFKREIIYFLLFLSSVKLYRWFVANVMNWFHEYRYTYKDFFFLALVQKETAFYQTCFSHHCCLMYTFQGLFFFFCRRGVTSLSSVSTRQTNFSHSKLTHNPKIFTASLSCVWHFLDFVLIKTLVLTCNKRKIILYFVGCSEFLLQYFVFITCTTV